MQRRKEFLRRRVLVLGACALPLSIVSVLAAADKVVSAGGMNFCWSHHNDRLVGRLSAPGAGWLAVGFNSNTELEGTRFVIAKVADRKVVADVHIALPPIHRSISELNGQSGLQEISGQQVDGRSVFDFSLPIQSDDAYNVSLAEGSPVYLMLAYSHSSDFDHHSAWRGHQTIRL